MRSRPIQQLPRAARRTIEFLVAATAVLLFSYLILQFRW
jgi:hypothetical protein